jgi:hypothetical protein
MILNLHDHDLPSQTLEPPGSLLFQIVPEGHRSFSAQWLPTKSIFWYLDNIGGNDV